MKKINNNINGSQRDNINRNQGDNRDKKGRR